MSYRRIPLTKSLSAVWLLIAVAGGCHSLPKAEVADPVLASVAPVYEGMPRELAKVNLPEYRIEPPDILLIDALRISPRPPYELQTGDVVDLQVRNTLPDLPILGNYALGPGGVVDMGFPYGSLQIAGMTTEQAQEALTQHLREHLANPVVNVTLIQAAASQQIAGEHMVGPDGMVTLGIYGRVPVTGLTLEEARYAIEQHLSRFLEDPKVAVDVFAYNSKVYYVITEGAGLGDRVVRLPVTGNETVLDAIANINGLEQISSKRIWIARPTPGGEPQIMPISWEGITKLGVASTNYQVLPGDRIFIAEDNLVAFDTRLAKLIAPVERVFGFSILGAGAVTRFSGKVLAGGGARNAAGGLGGGGF